MTLEGSAALVTGASRGIGRAIALELAAQGADVAVNYLSNRASAEAVVEEIRALGRRSLAIAADVADPALAADCVAQSVSALGRLDVLVNNAGLTADGLITELSPDAWRRVMDVNFGGAVNCTRAAAEHMMAAGTGKIVNISSVMADRAWIGVSAYSASKAALNAFTRSAAVEFARFGIHVFAVLPGFVETEMVEHLTSKDKGRGIWQQIPARRFGLPEDVARLVAFLAQPEQAYMTGALVTIDGAAIAQLGLGRALPR